MLRTLLLVLTLSTLASACTAPGTSVPQSLTISIVGTNDVHGNLSQRQDRGGLTAISGYVNALRARRHEDGGGLLLIDAGDMWQGTLESNITEGAVMVAAYNAMRYDAAAIGNHEFDFGPLGPDAIATRPGQDPRGALKQRALEAHFPFLAANLIDADTNEAVKWPNVQPSVMVDAGGLSIGIVGVITSNALRATIAANVVGLRVAPLASTIEKEARLLRAAGADLVIVTAHAGGKCVRFDDPQDLSSCDQEAEIFAAAKALPIGLVDHIIAGHVHQGIAHLVNDISITSSFANTLAFSRVDFEIDTVTHRVLGRTIFPPTNASGASDYEGHALIPDADVAAITQQALLFAEEKASRRVGVHLETPFTLDRNPESTLGNLFTDALLQSFDADIVIHNVAGGLRRNLASGDLTFGQVYEMSPFDNFVVVLELSGAQLRRIVAEQSARGRKSMGFSGMRATVSCNAGRMLVELQNDDGIEIGDTDTVRVLTNDYLALGGDGIFAKVTPDGGFPVDFRMPLSRDLFLQWLETRGGSLNAKDYDTRKQPKWTRPERFGPSCRFTGIGSK